MKSMFGEQGWCDGSSVAAQLLVFATVLLASGCFTAARDTDLGGKVDVELAALMADGTLPSGMKPAPMPSEAPARSCGGGKPDPDDVDGGVDMPTTSDGGGVIIGSAGSGDPVKPAVRVAAGSAGRGGGMVPSPIGGSGAAGGDTAGQGSGPDAACAGLPIGFWTFDDCNTFRTDLGDSSFQSHPAFRSVDVACAAGQERQAVAFARAEDLVYAPDQPDFALDAGVTVAAWLKPDSVDRVRTIFRKRDDSNSAFALLINAQKYQFIVRLASGRLAAVSAPAIAGKWTHVAATYDGAYLRLYLNGLEASKTLAYGVIARGVGPLLMGNDAAGRHFQGLMDSAWFNTLAAPPATVLQLTCLRNDPRVTVSPEVSDPVQTGTVVNYTLSITNQNSAACAPESFVQFTDLPQQEFSADPSFAILPPLAGLETTQLSVAVASGDETDPDSYTIGFEVLSRAGGGGSSGSSGRTFVQAQYVVAEPSGCHVTSQRELMIRHVSVVDDPVRTTLDAASADPNDGAWTFGRLMQRLSPTAADAPAVTEAMFRSFLTPQSINSFTVDVRDPMDPIVLQPWPRTPDGSLDLARAPMRLLAITNRLDLTDLSKGKAGEGRFVFGVLDDKGNPLQFTVILEYLLAAETEADVRAWADAFHALQALPFPSEAYNQALQTITDRFTARNALPAKPNGSALIDIRTNEIDLSRDGQWQLREFHISPTTGFMDPATLFLTPDASFNFTSTLARFINQNEATILTETHEVPASFEDAPFQAGAVFNNIDLWDAPGITNPEARHKFSLNTCNGCHGAETNTRFLQVNPRFMGEPSSLSAFLTGEDTFDPITGQPRRLSELARRRQFMESVVCNDPQP